MSTPIPSRDQNADQPELRKVQQAVRFLDEIRRLKQRQQSQREGTGPANNGSAANGSRVNGKDGSEQNESDGATFVSELGWSPQLPTYIGRFETVRHLGAGTFGHVYLCRDCQLDRLVAIKLPKPNSMVSPEARRRFKREAKAASMLSHPAIVPAFEHNSSGLIPFIVSAYVEGPTLAEWIADHRQRITARMAARIVFRLAEAVEHAHQRGVIHRDLKPGNILVESDFIPPIYAGLPDLDWGHDTLEISHRVRITDFGLAKTNFGQSSDSLDSLDSLTASGAVLGTPAYMSPEQARGEKTIGGETDIFALGILLYEMLTGQIPFKRDSHLATLRALENEAPTPIRVLNKEIPKDIAAICLKCLEKSPADRYHTAYALAQDLSAWLAGNPIKARQPNFRERICRWYLSHPALSAAVLFAIISLTIGVSVSSWLYNASQKNLRLSEVQRFRAQSNANLLESTVVKLLDDYTRSLESNEEIRDWDMMETLLAAHQQLIETEAERLEVLPATIDGYVRLANINIDLHRLDEAQTICHQAGALLGMVKDEHQPTMLRPQLDLMWAEIRLKMKRHNHFGASSQIEFAIELLDQNAGVLNPRDQKIKARIFNQAMGRALIANDQQSAATPYLATALAIAATEQKSNPEDADARAVYEELLNEMAALSQFLTCNRGQTPGG